MVHLRKTYIGLNEEGVILGEKSVDLLSNRFRLVIGNPFDEKRLLKWRRGG